MRAKCYLCKTWNKELGQYEYYLAEKTDWRPPPGYDSNLRQFKCAECGGVFYKVLGTADLAQEFGEKHPVA